MENSTSQLFFGANGEWRRLRSSWAVCLCDQVRLGTIIKIIGPLFPYWQAKIISFSYALLFKRKTSNFLNLEFVSSKTELQTLKKFWSWFIPSLVDQIKYYFLIEMVNSSYIQPKQSCGTSIISESSQVMSNSRSNLEESSLPSKE